MTEGYRYCHSHRVRYIEIDGQNVVFNSHYLAFCMDALIGYWQNLKLTVIPDEHNVFDVSLIKSTIELKGPAYFNDLLNVYVKISRMGNTSLTVNYMIVKENNPKPIVLVEAIYAGFNTNTKEGAPIPHDVRNEIETFERTAPVLI